MPPELSPPFRAALVAIFVANYLAGLYWDWTWTAHRNGFDTTWYLLSMALLFMSWGAGGTRDLCLTEGRYVVRGWFRVHSGPIGQVADIEQPGRDSYRLRFVDGSTLRFSGSEWALPAARAALDRIRRLEAERADDGAREAIREVRPDARVLLVLCAVLLAVALFGRVPVRYVSALGPGS